MDIVSIESPHGMYEIDTDPARIDIDAVVAYLSNESYWAKGRRAHVIAQSIENSLNFGLYAEDGSLAGFARLVTDGITFGWLCDVFVLEQHRGNGLGKAMMQAVTDHADSTGLGRIILATRDAHGLYASYGFENMTDPTKWMDRLHPKLANR